MGFEISSKLSLPSEDYQYNTPAFRRLVKWAMLQGIADDFDSLSDKEKRIFSAETVSRVWAVKSLRNIQPDLDILQTDLTEKFDCKIYSGGTWQKVEHKYRKYPSTKFPDFGLSPAKYNYCRQRGIWLLVTFSDGVYYLWDLAAAEPEYREWEHNKTTMAPEDGKIREMAYFFKPEDAKFKGCLDAKS